MDDLLGVPGGEVAGNVRWALARFNLNGGDAARHLGMSKSAFSKRRAGDVAWKREELERLGELMGLTADELAHGTRGEEVRAVANKLEEQARRLSELANALTEVAEHVRRQAAEIQRDVAKYAGSPGPAAGLVMTRGQWRPARPGHDVE